MQSNELKAQRALRKKTQRECADAIWCSVNTYNFKENGITPFTTDEAVKLCDFLDITDDSLKVSIFL